MSLSLWALGGLLGGLLAAATLNPEVPWGQLVTQLQDIRSDYAEASEAGSADAYQSIHERLQKVREIAAELQSSRAKANELVDALESFVVQRAAPRLLEQRIDGFIVRALEQGLVPRVPPGLPNLQRGRTLYIDGCAACHGLEGVPPPAIFHSQRPPPAQLNDPERMNGLSVFRVFLTITHGISDTAMPAYSTLSDMDRWSIAFHVMGMRHLRCEQPPRNIPLEELTQATDGHLVATYGEAALACVRLRPVFPQALR